MHDSATLVEKHDILRSVTRALAVLDLLGQHPEGLLAKRISHELRLNISTCYHLLNTLLAAGYVVRDADSLLIRLGPKIEHLYMGFARSASDAEWRLLHPVLARQFAEAQL